MILTGQITKILPNSNVIEVDIPAFRNAGSSIPVRINCNVCYNAGYAPQYAIDDFVYIGFVQNDYSDPIILGKIYKGNNLDSLTDSLSTKALLNGESLLDTINAMKLEIDRLKSQINDLRSNEEEE